MRPQFILRYQRHIHTLLIAIEALESARREYSALDYTNTLQENDLPTSAAFTLPQFKDAVATLDAIEALLDAGHRTNLYRVRQVQ